MAHGLDCEVLEEKMEVYDRLNALEVKSYRVILRLLAQLYKKSRFFECSL